MGAPAPRPGCGSCTLCCTVMKVDMTPPKPEHVPCWHCTRAGCEIYADRPKPCRVFECLWLGTQARAELPTLPSALRPDRCGVVMEVNTASYIIAHCHWPAAWKRAPILAFLTDMTSRTRVLIENQGGTTLLMPDGSTRALMHIGVDPKTNERLYALGDELIRAVDTAKAGAPSHG